MRESKNPIAIRSQNMIFSAFFSLLSRMPVEDISVGLICKTADIDRRTFYRYFENKNDVLCSYLDKLFDEYMQQASVLTVQNPSDYVKLFFSFFSGSNHVDFLTSLYRNGSLSAAFFGNDRYMSEISKLINEKLNRGDNHYATTFRVGGFAAVLTEWIGNGCRESVDDMVATITKVLR